MWNYFRQRYKITLMFQSGLVLRYVIEITCINAVGQYFHGLTSYAFPLLRILISFDILKGYFVKLWPN